MNQRGPSLSIPWELTTLFVLIEKGWWSKIEGTANIR